MTFAHLRSRLVHRRAAVRICVAMVVVIWLVRLVAGPSPTEQEVLTVSVPPDYRVLSMPIDERVPPLDPGDEIDLYLGTDTAAIGDPAVIALDQPGLVTFVDESAFSVAVPEEHLARIAGALRNGDALVVRR